MRHYFLLVTIVFVGIVIAIRGYIKTPQGKFMIDGYKLKMPVFGILLTKVAISKFTRTLSTLVRSGVPILTALEIVAKTSGNVVVEDTVNRVRESVKEGESIATPLEKSKIFPPLVTRMVAVGEKEW